MAFKSDTRGLGGQKQIMDLMQNHYSAMQHIKSTLNTRMPPRPHVDSKKVKVQPSHQRQLMGSAQYAEQREAFRRLAAVQKGYTDSSAPATYHRAQKMQVNRRARVQSASHQVREHESNLASLHRRMMAVGNVQDRKKNPFDPIANPVFFFAGKGEKSQSIIGYAKKIVSPRICLRLARNACKRNALRSNVKSRRSS